MANQQNENQNQQQYYSQASSDAEVTDDGFLSDIHTKSTVRVGPLGIDPLHYTEFIIACLTFWVMYLLIPRGYRKTICGSYPKRYAWSSRTKRKRRQRQQGLPFRNGQNGSIINSASSVVSMSTVESSSTMNTNHRELAATGIGTAPDLLSVNTNNLYKGSTGTTPRHLQQPLQGRRPQSLPEEEEVVDFSSPNSATYMNSNTPFSAGAASAFNDEIAISTTMQQLRDTGIQIIAHGSKGKPKKVRLSLTEVAIEWKTESKKKNKVSKTHQVPLTHIMYVDVGKATTALRRVENASIPDNLCLSLLTKEGSLDLQASTALERDALVNCFSLVLDEIHAQNWRDVYRAPSSDMPSSFDDYDGNFGARAGQMEV